MDNFGRDLGRMMGCMMTGLVVFVPLGIWKLTEIVVWLFSHVSIERV